MNKINDIVNILLQQAILTLARKLMERGELKAAQILLETKPEDL